ncbi:MAG TPA: DUF6351 family protein, partial [Actinomycetota bacterium]|nr:DUF6351 family protein [Actinomycetota bacterium]
MTSRTIRLLLAGLMLVSAAAVAQADADPVQIRVLSNRADLISGGDALVAIDLPEGADASDLAVTLGGTDVSDAFAVRSDGVVKGLLTGMSDGTHALTAELPSGAGARIDLTVQSHLGGPIFSGPQIQPWRCAPGGIDEKCNRAPTYT